MCTIWAEINVFCCLNVIAIVSESSQWGLFVLQWMPTVRQTDSQPTLTERGQSQSACGGRTCPYPGMDGAHAELRGALSGNALAKLCEEKRKTTLTYKSPERSEGPPYKEAAMSLPGHAPLVVRVQDSNAADEQRRVQGRLHWDRGSLVPWTFLGDNKFNSTRLL